MLRVSSALLMDILMAEHICGSISIISISVISLLPNGVMRPRGWRSSIGSHCYEGGEDCRGEKSLYYDFAQYHTFEHKLFLEGDNQTLDGVKHVMNGHDDSRRRIVSFFLL